MISIISINHLILTGITLALAIGIANRLRGGALYDYLKIHKRLFRVSHTVTRSVVAILTLMSFYIPLKYNTGVEIFSSWQSIIYTFLAFVSFFIFGLCSGWGSYFDLGATRRDYVDHREVLWIDYILNWIFGPIWIPTDPGHKTIFEMSNNLKIDRKAFDIAIGPEGEGRPKEWRFKRDFIGMSLRGLQFYFPLTIIIYYQFKICFNVEYVSLFYIIPFGLLFGLMYKIGQWLDFFKTRYINHSTEKGEILTGIFLFSAIPYFILLFNY